MRLNRVDRGLADLPVAIVGAGPVGLAAAARLSARGVRPLVFERGPHVGASVRRWAHVSLFSPWNELIDAGAAELLAGRGWRAPPLTALPTGRELVSAYLEPLASVPELKPHLRLNADVASVTRAGIGKLGNGDRGQTPFVLRVRTKRGEEQEEDEEDVIVRAVIDASGTYESPNPLGASGTPALGEAEVQDAIVYGIPDVLGPERDRYAGRRVLVVGGGHSAANILLDLNELAAAERETRVSWIVRDGFPSQLRGQKRDRDALPARTALSERVTGLVARGDVELVSLRIGELRRTTGGLIARGAGGSAGPVDEIIAATGFRPELAMLRELRLALDPASEAPIGLAPLIDPELHDCGTVPAHGELELRQPEPGFYIVGMKSYGRAPTFLLKTGYSQVRSVADALTPSGASELALAPGGAAQVVLRACS